MMGKKKPQQASTKTCPTHKATQQSTAAPSLVSALGKGKKPKAAELAATLQSSPPPAQ